MVILKIGGSLLTDRGRVCSLNASRTRDYARALRAHWGSFHRRLILILGGGSYGHNVVRCHGLQRGAEGSALIDRQMLTLSLLDLKLELVRQLRDEGIPCFPFHTSSLLTTRRHEIASCHLDSVFSALADGILPVFTGDVVFDRELGFVLFSSDRVPELFLGRTRIDRLVVLTDVPGVFDASGQVVELVDDANWRAVWSATGQSAKEDVTGGMRSKFESVLQAARAGVDCVIADGSEAAAGMAIAAGTREGGTRIRLARTARFTPLEDDAPLEDQAPLASKG